MAFTPSKEKTNRDKTSPFIEIVAHLILIIIIPAIYLDVTTGFDKYALPEFINYVYGYWMIYIILTPILYGVFKKKVKYKKFRRK